MYRFGKTRRLWEQICSNETIERAMRHSLVKHRYPYMRSAGYSKAQKKMIANWDECKATVRRMLVTETYEFQRLNQFKVFEPKERVINCPKHYPDKIILICVYMVLRDYFYSKFVRNTYNCIKGRGIHDAKSAIEHIMNTHPDWYYVQTDIKKFYPTLNHDVIKADLRTVFKDVHVLKLLDAIIDMFHENIDEQGREIGVAIGVNMSQLMAILVNIPILREINEKWKYPSINFTDDGFTAVPTKHDGHKFVKWYIARCAERGMRVKPNYRIAPMREPVRMLGYQFMMDAEGKEYTLLGKPNKMRMKEKAKKLEKLNLSDAEWKQQMASYYGWCKHACCRNLMRKTFGERYKLFESKMKTFEEVKREELGEFGLKRATRKSVLQLLNQQICFEDAKVVIKKVIDKKTGEESLVEKVAVKYRHVKDGEPTGDSMYFISGSQSLKDRAIKAQPSMPFVASVVQHGGQRKYYAIE